MSNNASLDKRAMDKSGRESFHSEQSFMSDERNESKQSSFLSYGSEDTASDNESEIKAGDQFFYDGEGEEKLYYCVGLEDDLFNLPFDKRTLDLRIKGYRGRAHPEVPSHPAPFDPPPHFNKIPISLLAPPKVDSQLSRTLNSSMGRCCTFICTYICFALAVVSLVFVQDNAPSTGGLSVTGRKAFYFALGCLSLICIYVFCPMLSEKSGMHPHTAGWKTYLTCYRLSFLCAIPALIFYAIGFGSALAFGDADGEAGKLLIQNVSVDKNNYFEAVDGFVALNLTKGIIATVSRTDHGDANSGPRRSRFRNAELLINKEPYTGLTEPTRLPGIYQYYVIAPIFQKWEACETYYQISGNCLEQNPIVGWALAEGKSLCNDINLVACKTAVPELRPVYKCSSADKMYGREAMGAVEGLCGRVLPPPAVPEEVFDELSALFVVDGWPGSALPSPSQVWINVDEDACIDNPGGCMQIWDTCKLIAIIFTVVTVLCIAIPCCIDYQMDKRIREVKKYWDEKQAASKIMA